MRSRTSATRSATAEEPVIQTFSQNAIAHGAGVVEGETGAVFELPRPPNECGSVVFRRCSRHCAVIAVVGGVCGQSTVRGSSKLRSVDSYRERM